MYLFTYLLFISLQIGCKLHESKDLGCVVYHCVSIIPKTIPGSEWVLNNCILNELMNLIIHRYFVGSLLK